MALSTGTSSATAALAGLAGRVGAGRLFRTGLFLHALSALLLALALPASAETTFYMARVAPILDKHCVACHGPEKQKGKLRLDSYAAIVKGAESGDVLAAGQAAKSELLRRVRLPASDDEVMPSDGKPLLSANDIKVLQLWIAAGASETQVPADFPDAPALAPVARPVVPLTADWRPRAAEIATLARAIIREFPDRYPLYSIKEFTWNNIKQPNRNGLLLRDSSVDGMKTGFVCNSGFNLVATATRDGRRLGAVIFGANSGKHRADLAEMLGNVDSALGRG